MWAEADETSNALKEHRPRLHAFQTPICSL